MNNIDTHEIIIQELRDKLLDEKLCRLQSSIERVENLSSKTYEQSLVTNGRLTSLENSKPIERIENLESKIQPVETIYRYRKQIITVGIILYLILAASMFGTDVLEILR